MIPVVSIVGKSNSGKTTLIENLVPLITAKGYKVGTIKHDAHSFDIDVPGKDSWRHAQAGASTVLISSPEKIAMIKRTPGDKSLDQLLGYMEGNDIIVTEGYKSAAKPKIEVCRSERSTELICEGSELIAVVSDLRFEGLTNFGLNDYRGIADFIEERFLVADICKTRMADKSTI